MRYAPVGEGMGPLRIAGIASHGGTNLRHIDRACRDGEVNATMAVLISNNGDSDILNYSAQRQIEARHLSRKTHPNSDDLDRAFLQVLEDAAVDVVFLSGYMRKLGPRTVARFRNRVLNVHPALLPKFGGQGMYGDRVYEAVLGAGETLTGATVHLVDEEYDHGPVVRQLSLPVLPGDSIESLRTRVRDCELNLCVSVIHDLAAKHVDLDEIARQFRQDAVVPNRLAVAASSVA